MRAKSLRWSIAAVGLLLPSLSYAGGDGWEFAVESFRYGGDVAYVVLVPVDRRPWFAESCAALQVSLRWKPEPFWRRRTWSRVSVNRSTHVAALAKLEAAAKAGSRIRFGSMGTGLVPAPDTPCSFESRGLAELSNTFGSAIYSHHDPL